MHQDIVGIHHSDLNVKVLNLRVMLKGDSISSTQRCLIFNHSMYAQLRPNVAQWHYALKTHLPPQMQTQ